VRFVGKFPLVSRAAGIFKRLNSREEFKPFPQRRPRNAVPLTRKQFYARRTTTER
jgi:hypothetical protein